MGKWSGQRKQRLKLKRGLISKTSGGLSRSKFKMKRGRLVSIKASNKAKARFQQMMKNPDFKAMWNMHKIKKN